MAKDPIPPVSPPPGADGPTAEPEVVNDRGHSILRVTTPFVDEFAGHYPSADSPETPVTVTRAGVQLAQSAARHLQNQAAQHGVELSIEKVEA